MIAPMNRLVSTLAISALFVACANHEGVYEPACIAYEGDTIEFRNGRFEWQRFTDQRTFDADGNVVKPLPEFPKTGTYSIESGRLELVTDDGIRLEDWFIVVRSGARYLLTRTQYEVFRESNEMSGCALKLTDSDS
jgi:hypothetical protein